MPRPERANDPEVFGCCACARHPDAADLDKELRLLGTPKAPARASVGQVARKYGFSRSMVTIHRLKHLGQAPLPMGGLVGPKKPLPKAAPRSVAAPLREGPRPKVQPVPVVPVEEPPKPPPNEARERELAKTDEGRFAQLVRTVATLIQLDSWRGITTVRALAARHGVSEEEVLQAHRRASLSVRDARGSLREQLELSVAALTAIKHEERKVAQDYTAVAENVLRASLPRVGPNGQQVPPQRTATREEVEVARAARSVAAQAQDCAIAAQKQIDQNTIHRRTAPIVRVSFSASKDFSRAQDALVLLLCAFVGPEREDAARASVARGLQVLEDAGEDLTAPEFLAYLEELRQDAQAVTVEGEGEAAE